MVQSGRGKASRSGLETSLGVFSNFPTITHGIAKVTFSENVEKVQKSIIQALHKLNGLTRKYPISLTSRTGTRNGRVGFEVGVAEGIYFNYLNDEVTRRLFETLSSMKFFPLLDFLIIITYHYNSKGKKIHLNFDYHQLRFLFDSHELEIRLFHCKGIRRMPLDELFSSLMGSIAKEMKQRSMKPLNLRELHVL